MIANLLLFAGTAAVGVVTCRMALRIVTRLSILDHPNERSSHVHPTPRGGGLGIVAALLPGAVVAAFVRPAGLSFAAYAAIGAATVALAVLGWVDDRRGVGAAVKLLVQAGAAVAVVAGAGAVRSVALPGAGDVALGAAGPILTVAWLIAFSNGFNFMDGIDGLAGLFAGLSGMFLATAAAIAGSNGMQWLALPVAAASFAFLTVNRPPAKVFMGDVGSLPLGFLLALIAVLGVEAGVPFPAAFLILGPFLFDTATTIARRVSRGENLTAAHRSHLYQRLVAAGWSHGRVCALYGGWTVLTGLLGLLYLHDSTGWRALALSAAAASGVGMVLLVRRAE